MTYRNENENLKAHVQSLRVVILALLVLIGLLWLGWNNAKKITPVHLPPDLRQGALILPNDPQPIHVYALALMVIQILNHWASDGAVDYGKAIDSVKPYLTPRFYAQLKDDLKQRIIQPDDGIGISVDELTGRVRSIQPIPGLGYSDNKVNIRGNGSWTVQLDLHIDEEVKGMNVKAIDVRYPIRVISYDVDSNDNPWGLALDGFDAPGPSRIATDYERAKTASLGKVPPHSLKEH